MKLYTEEQVRQVFLRAQTLDDNGNRLYDFFDEIKHDGDLTPIELPSDEEVEKMRKEYIEHINTIVHRDLERDGYLDLGFLAGAKNIIYKIQGGNK